MLDLSYKIKEAGAYVQRLGRSGGQTGGLAMSMAYGGGAAVGNKLDKEIEKVARDSKGLATKEMSGLMAGEIKAKIFNGES